MRYQLRVSNKNESGGLQILFDKVYRLKTTTYEVKLVQFANGKILLSILVKPKRTPTHIASLRNIPAPIRYQIIKDLIDSKLAHILDQI